MTTTTPRPHLTSASLKRAVTARAGLRAAAASSGGALTGLVDSGWFARSAAGITLATMAGIYL